MKINTIKYIALLVLSVLILSCKKDIDRDLLSKGEGVLSLKFGYNLDANVVTKGGDPIFTISVIDFKTGVIIKTIEDHNSLKDNPLTLKAGKYIIAAANGIDVTAGFESPYYMGRDTVDVIAGKAAAASMVCTLANVKVSVNFSDAVTANFSNYDVTITNNQGGSLIFDKGHINTAGYFKCTGSLKWTINLTNNDGKTFEISNNITNVKPREYYKLNFDVDGNTGGDQGGASLKVSYDNSMNVKEYSIDVSLNKKAVPTILEASGVDLSNTLRIPQGAGVIGLFNINSAAGVSEVTISHNNSSLTNIGIPNSFNPLTADKAALLSKGITWSDYTVGANSLSVDFRKLFSDILPLGTYNLKIAVLDKQSQFVETQLNVVIIPNVEVSTIRIDAWAKYAFVYAQYSTESQPNGMAIQYKRSSDSQWSTYSGALTIDGSAFSAKIEGLIPSTSYDFRAVSTKDLLEDKTFTLSATTEAAAQLPNLSFDAWFKQGKNWFPNADLSEQNYIWDSGNTGANTISEINPTSPEESFVKSGKAIKLKSSSVFGILAAGNVYSGYFVGTYNTTNARISFGRPFTSRPVAMKGFYSYAPVAINKVKDPYTSLKGQNDIGQIYIMLTDWNQPYIVDSGLKNFINPGTDPNVIAYGEITENTNTNGYKEFTINLNYKNDRKPKYIVIVASASKYGDYFTGGEGSTMYLDELELLY